LFRTIILVLLALSVSAISVDSLIRQFEDRRMIFLARKFEQGPRPTLDYIRANAPWVENDYTAHCLAVSTKARLSVALSYLDAALGEANFAIIDRAREMAARAARERLSCVPADGNAWLRLFAVDIIRQGVTPQVQQQLLLSYRYAPLEEWVMSLRLPLAGDLTYRGNLGYDAQVEREFRAFVALGRNIEIPMSLLARFPEKLAGLMPSIVPLVSRERQNHIRYWAEQIDLNIGMPTEMVEIKDPFTGQVMIRRAAPVR
jgi:hypothetical protein